MTEYYLGSLGFLSIPYLLAELRQNLNQFHSKIIVNEISVTRAFVIESVTEAARFDGQPSLSTTYSISLGNLCVEPRTSTSAN